jgi:hypothetical protein
MKQHKIRWRIPADYEGRSVELVQIYSHPEEGAKYTIGLDAATGFGSDYTSIQVWSNRVPFEQVAWLRNKRITTVKGTEVLHLLARYYNNAFIVPETRHPGNAYVDNLIEVYGYGQIYKRKQDLDTDPTISTKYGICTTEADKHLLINEAKKLLEHPDGAGSKVVFHDPVTLNEFCNYVYKEDKSKTGAMEGANDDTVMATLLAWRGCSMLPQAQKERVRVYSRKDEDKAHKAYLDRKFHERIFGPKGRRHVRV